MKPTRRRFLLTAGAAVGYAALPHAPLVAAAAATTTTSPRKATSLANYPVRTRKSVYDLTDAEVKSFCRAVSYMRNGSKELPLSVDNPLQWDQYMKIHSRHCTEAGFEQVHWSWWFLPWHRGYLFFLEQRLADILTNVFKEDGSKFGLPYWDWSTQRTVPNTRERINQGKPSPFFGYDRTIDNPDGDDLGFDNLALWDGYRHPTVEKPDMTVANEPGPKWAAHTQETLDRTSPTYIREILRYPDFHVVMGEKTIDRKSQGLIELYPHNLMHDWVGSRWGKNRDMGTLRYAALDPMFNMHHGNIDRVWSLYAYTPDPNDYPVWRDKKYTYRNERGEEVTVSVGEIVRYISPLVRYQPPSSAAEPLLAAKRPAARKARIETVLEKKAVLSTKPLTLAPTESKPNVAPLLRSGADATEDAPSLLVFETGPIAYRGRFTIRVFVNKGDADENTGIDDEHYIGALFALDSEGRDGSNESTTNVFYLPVSRAISNFYKVVEPGQPFTITLVPVVPRSARDFHITVKRVKLEVF